MNSIEDRLTNSEAIVYRTNFHWAMLLGPMFLIVIGGLALRSQGVHAAALMAFGLLWGIFSYLSVQRSEMALTGKRLLINAGFPVVRSSDMQLSEIAGIDFYQPSLGSLLNFGKIMIVRKGQGRSVFRFVSGPAELVARVRQQIAELNPSPDAES